MPAGTFSIRDFTRDVSAAKRTAVNGLVFAADKVRSAYALLKIEGCCRMAGRGEPTFLSVMDGSAGADSIAFNPARLNTRSRPAGFD